MKGRAEMPKHHASVLLAIALILIISLIRPMPVSAQTLPVVTIANGNYVYTIDYGNFTFSGTTPLSYSITPNRIRQHNPLLRYLVECVNAK